MVNKNLKNIQIVLASGSPRRQQFLKDLGIDFKIRLKEVAEIYPATLVREEITNFLAILKAKSQQELITDQELLITSDTIVWLENEALGKPKDFEDARQILLKLSGKTHEVITSVCFFSKKTYNTIFDVTEVTFGVLSNEMIEFYLKEFQPFDKAGAYGIQDWIGLVGVTSIKGSYTNVMGLPTEKVFSFLKDMK